MTADAPTSQGDHTNSQDNVISGNSESRGVHHKVKSGLTQQKRTNNRYSFHQNPHPSKKYSGLRTSLLRGGSDVTRLL